MNEEKNSSVKKDKKDKTEWIIIGIYILIFISLIIYLIVLYECYKKQIFIFTPYREKTPPEPYFYPLAPVFVLTAQQIADRNANIAEGTTTPGS